MSTNDERILKARDKFYVNIDNPNIPTQVVKYIEYLEKELVATMYETEYWVKKYLDEKDKDK